LYWSQLRTVSYSPANPPHGVLVPVSASLCGLALEVGLPYPCCFMFGLGTQLGRRTVVGTHSPHSVAPLMIGLELPSMHPQIMRPGPWFGWAAPGWWMVPAPRALCPWALVDPPPSLPVVLVQSEFGWRPLGPRIAQFPWLATSSLAFLFSFSCWNFLRFRASCASVLTFTFGVGGAPDGPSTNAGSLFVTKLGLLAVLATACCCGGLSCSGCYLNGSVCGGVRLECESVDCCGCSLH